MKWVFSACRSLEFTAIWSPNSAGPRLDAFTEITPRKSRCVSSQGRGSRCASVKGALAQGCHLLGLAGGRRQTGALVRDETFLPRHAPSAGAKCHRTRRDSADHIAFSRATLPCEIECHMAYFGPSRRIAREQSPSVYGRQPRTSRKALRVTNCGIWGTGHDRLPADGRSLSSRGIIYDVSFRGVHHGLLGCQGCGNDLHRAAEI
jgi:hypothetical protein